jgi:hypothetical protein
MWLADVFATMRAAIRGKDGIHIVVELARFWRAHHWNDRSMICGYGPTLATSRRRRNNATPHFRHRHRAPADTACPFNHSIPFQQTSAQQGAALTFDNTSRLSLVQNTGVTYCSVWLRTVLDRCAELRPAMLPTAMIPKEKMRVLFVCMGNI